MYDEATISAELRVRAEQADDEYRLRAPESNLDEVLARSCVYGCLHDRHFLESQDKLVNELRWLKQTNRPRAPRDTISVERFQDARNQLLDDLIARFAGG
jgi:NH3-dependent NAD+ synthetase